MYLADKEPFLTSVDIKWDQGYKKNMVKLVSSYGNKLIAQQDADEVEHLVEFEAASLLPKDECWVVSFTDSDNSDGRYTRVWFRQVFHMNTRPRKSVAI